MSTSSEPRRHISRLLGCALSFSLLLHVSQFVPVTVWGLVLLFVEHVSLAEAVRTQDVPQDLR